MLSPTIRTRGFLPELNPLRSLPSEYRQIDLLGSQIPLFFGSPYLRHYFEQFPLVDVSELSGMKLFRAGSVYLFAQSAYIHNHKQKTAKIIPRSLAIPCANIAEKLRIPPILSYFFYCLNNWYFLGKKDDFNPDNLHIIQSFISEDCENWFIVIHVSIEHHAGEGLAAFIEAQQEIRQDNVEVFKNKLETASHSLEKMIEILKRMPERCSPEDYYHKVRPQIHGFDNIIYEGVKRFGEKPQSFRGETGAQSTAIPAMKKFLGIRHKSSLLTVHLDDMINYMHPLHRGFLEFVPFATEAGSQIRDYAKKLQLCDAYNDCVKGVHEFQRIHFGYAMDYIANRVSDPKGTGGTPFIQWLSQMMDETLSFLI